MLAGKGDLKISKITFRKRCEIMLTFKEKVHMIKWNVNLLKGWHCLLLTEKNKCFVYPKRQN